MLVLNKVDRMKKPKLLPRIEQYAKSGLFQEIVPISAQTGDDCDRLLDVLWDLLPEGEPLFDPELLTIHPERFLVTERIREKVLELTTRRAAVLDRRRPRALGGGRRRGDRPHLRLDPGRAPGPEGDRRRPQGSMIKAIGTAARLDLEEYLETPRLPRPQRPPGARLARGPGPAGPDRPGRGSGAEVGGAQDGRG